MKIPKPSTMFINLTNECLTPTQEELLNLGFNCHVKKPFDSDTKMLELERLARDIAELEAKGIVEVSSTLLHELVMEGKKRRGYYRSKILTKELWQMPVPVTPQKRSSLVILPVTPCASVELSGSHVLLENNITMLKPGSDTDPSVLAGYRDCLRESIRFLIHEEHLPPDHPVVAGLALHLTRDTAHQELEKLSQELAEVMNKKEMVNGTSVEHNDVLEAVRGLLNGDEKESSSQGYEITLIEDETESDISEDEALEMEMDDYEFTDDENDLEEIMLTAEDLLSHPELRRQLIRLVYQGCDLIGECSGECPTTDIKEKDS